MVAKHSSTQFFKSSANHSRCQVYKGSTGAKPNHQPKSEAISRNINLSHHFYFKIQRQEKQIPPICNPKAPSVPLKHRRAVVKPPPKRGIFCIKPNHDVFI
jgi:hypothetical protein